MIRLRLTNTATIVFAFVGMAKEQVGPGQALTPFVPLQFVQPGTTREADCLLDKVCARTQGGRVRREVGSNERVG